MSFKEIIFFRIPQQYQYHIKGRIQRRKKVSYKDLTINPSFLLPKYEALKLKEKINKGTNFNSFSFFDTKINLCESIDWCKDYKNNKSSTLQYYAKYNRQDFEKVGDIKYVFEPSRFYFLPFLALYHLAHKDKESIRIIEKVLNDWHKQNPFLHSIHWTSGIEVGIRSIILKLL